LVHWERRAASRAAWTAGSSRAIRTAMIAMTTSSSISVNPRRRADQGLRIGKLLSQMRPLHGTVKDGGRIDPADQDITEISPKQEGTGLVFPDPSCSAGFGDRESLPPRVVSARGGPWPESTGVG